MKEIYEALKNSYSYKEYRELVEKLLNENKSTSKNDSQALVDYSKLNHSRMKRLDKTTKIPEEIEKEIQKIENEILWVVISEGWCGDAAQNLPGINKMAELNKNITLRIVLRDENTDLMNQFLTNGNQAIPKLIQVENKVVTATWGPRPSVATKLVLDHKKEHGILDAEFKKNIQIWYNTNKNENLFEDFLTLITKRELV